MQIVSLSLPDAKTARDAVAAAHWDNVTLDMHEGYRKLNRQTRSSAMTLSLKAALDILDAAIEVAPNKKETLSELPAKQPAVPVA